MPQESAASDPVVDELVDGLAPRAFDFLERLVREPSLLGEEQGVLAVVAHELASQGFAVQWLPIPSEISADPAAGVPSRSYEGRNILVARRGQWREPTDWRSLLINGHLDVVPPGNRDLWDGDPFEPRRTDDGRIVGRGAGDMKAGFAMVSLALEALAVSRPESRDWPLVLVGAIEEECSGNGTLASVRAGVEADGVLIPEPTDLTLSLWGTGVLWIDITTSGRAAHAKDGAGQSAMVAMQVIIAALERHASELKEIHQPHGADRNESYPINVGLFHAGEWRSSVPDEAMMGVRCGFPSDWTIERAEQHFSSVIERAADLDPWLAEHRPRFEFAGLRATGYSLDEEDELVQILSRAHYETHGTAPDRTGVNGATDARFYRNQLGVPALCYGPTAHNIHGPNESVELQSIVDGARTLTRAIPAWIEGGSQ